MTSPVTVAVLNSNEDVVEMLRTALERAGFVVVSGHVDDIRRGKQSLSDLIDEHDPRVLVYDLVPPYDRSWRFLEHLQTANNMEGRRFVITSANAAATRELVGTSANVYEIVGKPYDIDAIVKAVSGAAANASPTCAARERPRARPRHSC